MRTFLILLGTCLLFSTQANWSAQAQIAAEQVVTLNPPGESYIDPEILPGGALLTYQTEGGAIYVAQLDPVTGLFVNGDGKDMLIDSGAARPLETFNGPEFGIDANGWALFYAKEHDGVVQIWRATLHPDGTTTEPLTTGVRHQTQLASRNPAADSTRLAAIEGTWQDGTAVWFDEAEPSITYPIDIIVNGITAVRWVDNSDIITYSERDGENTGQIVLLDTSTGQRRTITNDAGDKTDPYGWFAPEYGGEMLVLAAVDSEAIAIYRDTGGAHWERIATIYPPPESRHTFVSSAEPFIVGGQSYFSVIIKNATDNRQRFTDGEVWLMGIQPDGDLNYTERCDDGSPGMSRSDPEIFIGETNVFVYYNVIAGPNVDTPYSVRRCKSDLTVTGTPITGQDEPALTTSASIPDFCQWLSPSADDSSINHYICHDESVESRDRLLVFFPGTGALPSDYQLFVQEAASMGLHAVGLQYRNARSVNLQICRRDPDPNCHELVRREVIFGEDLHPGVSVDAENSITRRLTETLRIMRASDPDGGWEQYLDANGDPLWDQIVVAGHSQGAGMAAYIAHNFDVDRAILFAWTDIYRGSVASWILDTNATLGDDIYVFEHLDDRTRGEQARADMRAAFGVTAFGEANIDDTEPPYNNAHSLVTAMDTFVQGPRPSASAHNVVIADDFTPVVDGVPVLRDVWRYLLDVD